ncbi:MAG: hypothetical protein QF485_00680 [Arenicellales bacterium]|nr:hypothetical protein [Arenicellales bacterium]
MHGVLMPGWEMLLLRQRLQRNGFNCRLFRYSRRRRLPAENAAHLEKVLQGSARGNPLHFVAHSLGGIVLANLFAGGRWTADGRVVLLGSPLAGSCTARQLDRFRSGRWLLGRSLDGGLAGGGPEWPAGRETLVIAGNRGPGVGQLLTCGRLPYPSDGTVTVAETWSRHISNNQLMPVSHSGLLLSRQVADSVASFLRNECV